MYIGVDLGSTNIKVAVYRENLELVDRQSMPVSYFTEGGVVEFDAEAYFESFLSLLSDMLSRHEIKCIRQIAFTGQAESLVVLDKQGHPLMNGISWMDERSVTECEELAKQFPSEICERVTGQMAVLPTWPATKILWIRNHFPDIFQKAGCYMMLKDYVVYRLTGKRMADMSIATFTFYFDIYHKCYWAEMLRAIGICETQLPELCEPCTVAGEMLESISDYLHLSHGTAVNVGALDHFAGMIGTGNIHVGEVTLSTGTVMALATMCADQMPGGCGTAMHYGYLENSYVLLPVAESGGVSLEWFRRNCMDSMDYDKLNRGLADRKSTDIIFLPYLVGTNAPEFDRNASGVFWGLRQEHDAFDMARAVMEGVCFVLRKNCEHINEMNIGLRRIISTGGGSRSAVWCQMQADITGLPVYVPAEKEAACLGATMIAAVNDGRFSDFQKAAEYCVRFTEVYTPQPNDTLERKYRKFRALYNMALAVHDVN